MLGPADQLTLARLVLAPLAVASYLLLDVDGGWCFWITAALCGLAEATDWLDGRVARARGEVSDFGKLADPFCDVFYRVTLFLVLLLPPGLAGYPIDEPVGLDPVAGPLVFTVADGGHARGMLPFLPVLLMVLREVVAGALRSMSATRGLVLAARTSGKVKAWFQGTTIVAALGLPALLGQAEWQLTAYAWAAWICAALSIGSMAEYIWVNRATLASLVERRPAR